jgi:hypothetical protein
VGAAATQQALIPAAAGLDIGHTDKWLGTHRSRLPNLPRGMAF